MAFILKHVKVNLQVVKSLPIGSNMVMSSSSPLQLATITPISSRPGGVANSGNGANDIIRAYNPGGRSHDITGTQDETRTVTHQSLYSGAGISP